MATSKKALVLRASAVAVSIALLGTTSIIISVAIPDAAYAGKGNDKAKSNKSSNSEDRRSGNANSHSSSNDTGSSGGFSPKSNGAVKNAAKKNETSGNRISNLLGVHPSELGALNAANASANALANAAPNSRVGRIKLYADAVLAGQDLEDELLAALAAVEGKTRPTQSSEELAEAIELIEGDLVPLRAELEGLDAENPEHADQIADLTNEIGNLELELLELQDAQATAQEFETVDNAESELADQLLEQRSALEAAANKDVSDAIEAAVQKILGIYREPVVEDGPAL